MLSASLHCFFQGTGMVGAVCKEEPADSLADIEISTSFTETFLPSLPYISLLLDKHLMNLYV